MPRRCLRVGSPELVSPGFSEGVLHSSTGTGSSTGTYNIVSKYGRLGTGYSLHSIPSSLRFWTIDQTVLQTKSAAIRTPKNPP